MSERERERESERERVYNSVTYGKKSAHYRELVVR